MLEQAVTSLWAAMNGWFTPTALFVLLNLVIGTIFVTSKSIRKVHAHTKDEDGVGFFHHYAPRFDGHHYTLQQVLRSPSSVLERVKSIGSLYRHRSGEIPPETAAVASPAPATLASHHESEAKDTFETLDDAYKAATSASSAEHHFSRSQSDSDPTAGKMPVKLPSTLKKSASAKSAIVHFEEEEVVVQRPPATTRPGHQGEDQEVDAKADDFINRFRQQLKLQRLDSIMRYKEMLTGGR